MREKIKLVHLGIMFFLALVAVGIVLVELFIDLDSEQRLYLYRLTLMIITVFGIESIILFWLTEDKKNFFRENWYSLLVLIPPLKMIKALKVFKAIKGLKIFKTAKLGKKLNKKIKKTS